MEALSLASEKSWSLALTDDSAPDDFNSLFLTSLECNVLTVLVFLSPRPPAPLCSILSCYLSLGTFKASCAIATVSLWWLTAAMQQKSQHTGSRVIIVVLSSPSWCQHNQDTFGQVVLFGSCWSAKYFFTALLQQPLGLHLSLILTSLITTYGTCIKWPLGGIKDKH